MQKTRKGDGDGEESCTEICTGFTSIEIEVKKSWGMAGMTGGMSLSGTTLAFILLDQWKGLHSAQRTQCVLDMELVL